MRYTLVGLVHVPPDAAYNIPITLRLNERLAVWLATDDEAEISPPHMLIEVGDINFGL